MEKEIARLARAGKKGIIIDTNLLVIYLVGLYRKELVKDFVTSSAYLPEDFEIVRALMHKYKFEKCIVTPHILTEVSNLTFDHFKQPGREEYVRRAIGFIKASLEHDANKDQLINTHHLPKLGFADSSIVEVAKKHGYLVLTEDFLLAKTLADERCLSLNINHIRMYVLGK